MNWSVIQITFNYIWLFGWKIYNCLFSIFIYLSIKFKYGYKNLTGIDYSAASVELARNILQAEDLNDVTVKVSLLIFAFRSWYPDITLPLDRLSTVLACVWKWGNGMLASLPTFRWFSTLACRNLLWWIASKGLRECLQLPSDIRKADLVSDISFSLKSIVSHVATSKPFFSITQWQKWHICSCGIVLINRNLPWRFTFS